MRKFRNFQKKKVFWGPEGGGWVPKHPKLFYLSIFIILGGLEAKKCHFSKILIPENSDFKFSGALGGPRVNFFCQKWFQKFRPTLD